MLIWFESVSKMIFLCIFVFSYFLQVFVFVIYCGFDKIFDNSLIELTSLYILAELYSMYMCTSYTYTEAYIHIYKLFVVISYPQI